MTLNQPLDNGDAIISDDPIRDWEEILKLVQERREEAMEYVGRCAKIKKRQKKLAKIEEDRWVSYSRLTHFQVFNENPDVVV